MAAIEFRAVANSLPVSQRTSSLYTECSGSGIQKQEPPLRPPLRWTLSQVLGRVFRSAPSRSEESEYNNEVYTGATVQGGAAANPGGDDLSEYGGGGTAVGHGGVKSVFIYLTSLMLLE